MIRTKNFFLGLLFVSICFNLWGQKSEELIRKGWEELIKDNDIQALKLFNEAYQIALKNNDTCGKAESLLKLGIASYGSSRSNGVKYATKALKEFDKLDPSDALIGRSKCLTLLGTIKAREKKYHEAILLGKEAVRHLIVQKDTSDALGLAYGLLGSVYRSLDKIDSSDYYYMASHQERLIRKDKTYLPISYFTMGSIEVRKKHPDLSWMYFSKSFELAKKSSNRQAQISALLGKANWHIIFQKNYLEALKYVNEAKQISNTISDKSYSIKALSVEKTIYKEQNQFDKALHKEEEINKLKEFQAESDKVHLTKSLEVQFGLSEKERELKLVKKEKAISTLTNYLLFGILSFGSILAAGFILFLKRINKRDKQLLETKATLMNVEQEQKRLKEQQLQNEIEFKESQLSALTLQMLQKNELMQELKEKIESNDNQNNDTSISKIINRGLNQDREWSDFNKHFEAINKNFYSRIKQTFPDISPNDLKICALIKMNLSSKEMASILNISSDSVKTARYRLRKKLTLNTEDNLTNFILNI